MGGHIDTQPSGGYEFPAGIARQWWGFKQLLTERYPELDPACLGGPDQTVDHLVGLIQENYGLPHDIATRQLVDAMETFEKSARPLEGETLCSPSTPNS